MAGVVEVIRNPPPRSLLLLVCVLLQFLCDD